MNVEIFTEEYVAMIYSDVASLPTDAQLTSMAKAGYKFRLNGKIVSAKKIKEIKTGEKK